MKISTHERYRELMSEFISELAKEAANSPRTDRTTTGAHAAKIIIGIAQAEEEMSAVFPKPEAVPKPEAALNQ